MANFIIGGIVLVLLILAIRKIVKNNKSCGCHCSGCSQAKSCNNKLKIKK